MQIGFNFRETLLEAQKCSNFNELVKSMITNPNIGNLIKSNIESKQLDLNELASQLKSTLQMPIPEEVAQETKDFQTQMLTRFHTFDVSQIPQHFPETIAINPQIIEEYKELNVENSPILSDIYDFVQINDFNILQHMHVYFESHPELKNPINPGILEDLSRCWILENEELENVQECSICLVSYKGEFFQGNKQGNENRNGIVFIKLPCNHLFHEACIKEWFMYANTCPLCRAKVE